MTLSVAGRGRLASCWIGLAALLTAGVAAAAGPVSGAASLCDLPRAVPQRARLTQLLRELSTARRFRLEYWASDDPMVAHGGGNDIDLMTALSHQVNLMVSYLPSSRCPGQWRVDTVWVLPRGKASAMVVAAPPSDAASKAAASTAPDQAYLFAHGLGPAPPSAASAPEP